MQSTESKRKYFLFDARSHTDRACLNEKARRPTTFTHTHTYTTPHQRLYTHTHILYTRSGTASNALAARIYECLCFAPGILHACASTQTRTERICRSLGYSMRASMRVRLHVYASLSALSVHQNRE